MKTIKTTPSFLIALMEYSRQASSPGKILDTFQKIAKAEGILTQADLEKLSDPEDPTVKYIKPEQMAGPQGEEHQLNLREQVVNFMSDYLSNFDNDLTDKEIYEIFTILYDEAGRHGFSENRIKEILDYYILESLEDFQNLSTQELQAIINDEAKDEYGSQVLIQREHDAERPHLERFDEEQAKKQSSLPLSLRQSRINKT